MSRENSLFTDSCGIVVLFFGKWQKTNFNKCLIHHKKSFSSKELDILQWQKKHLTAVKKVLFIKDGERIYLIDTEFRICIALIESISILGFKNLVLMKDD